MNTSISSSSISFDSSLSMDISNNLSYLSKLNDTIPTINNSISSVNTIVNNEQQRLQMKKQNVDNALLMQERLISYNQNYQLLYKDYAWIIYYTVIACVIIFIFFATSTVVPWFPASLLSIITIIIVVISIIVKYTDMTYRNPMHYDQYNYKAPTIPNSIANNTAIQNASQSGNLLGTLNINGCIGPNCCSTGTKWDAGNSVCTTLSSAMNTNSFITVTELQNELTKKPTVKPYSAEEMYAVA